MTVMERLFATGRDGEFLAVEDGAREKQILRMVQKELAEADEPNLLLEEDMHVFDREPLADPLMLVSCNTCKRPVKSSQYRVHAERCRSSMNPDETIVELNGGSGHRRPPRKVRKKVMSPNSNHNIVGDTGRSESLEVDDAAPDFAVASATNLETPTGGMAHMHGNSYPTSKDGECVGLRGAECLDFLAPSSKRTKMSSAESAGISEELDWICGVRLSEYATCQESLTCEAHSESMKHAVPGRSKRFDLLLHDLKLKSMIDSRSHDQAISEIILPAPMATKVYYFRQHHQMRAVLGHLFHEALTRESSSPVTHPATMSEEEHSPSHRLSNYTPLSQFAHDWHQRTLLENKIKIQTSYLNAK